MKYHSNEKNPLRWEEAALHGSKFSREIDGWAFDQGDPVEQTELSVGI